MHRDQRGWHAEEVLHVAKHPLRELQREQFRDAAYQPRWRTGDAQCKQQRKGQPDHRPTGVRVQLRHVVDTEWEARRARVTGVWPGAGDDGADGDLQEHHRHHAASQPAQLRSDECAHRSVALSGSHV
jgi:hypothetical protein